MAYGWFDLQAFRIIGKGCIAVLKKLLWVIIGLLVATAAAAAWAWVDMHRYAQSPSGAADTRVIVNVAPGQSFNAFSAGLERHGIITSPIRFKILARVRDADKSIKAGEYALSPAMTPLQVLDTVVNARVLLHRLTIPEGHTLIQIAAEIDRIGISDAQAFKALARDPDLIAALGVSAPSLEGYLFPETYYFPRQVPARAIITTMVRYLHEQFSEEWHQRTRELNLSTHELLTLASIIEKETGYPSERPLVASVFHNRLQRGMRLESDPTAVYGIEGFDGRVTPKHLQTPTPYNTYQIRGLPPGPIANPGRAAIEAALYPAETDYLFFVSKKDGSHHFSPTYAEHHEAVRQYLRGGRP
jgi:UPF0755 protein